MKKIQLIFIAISLLIGLQSCEDPLSGGGTVPTCVWTQDHLVSFTNLQLQHPPGLSNFHSFRIPSDGIERSLTNITDLNGDAGSPSRANILVTLTADGNFCNGMSQYNYRQGASEVSIAAIDIKIPTDGFLGDVTVGISGDTFNNTVGNGNFYHILWTESGNDPNGGIVGNILGKKLVTTTIDGSTGKKIVSEDGCYIQNGEEVCM